MATKLLAEQYDPQYQYVIADPEKSVGFDPWKAATALYTSMYGRAPAEQFTRRPVSSKYDRVIDPVTGLTESMQRRANKTWSPEGYGSITIPYRRDSATQRGFMLPSEVDFMNWYAGAQDPTILNDPIAKEMLMETGKLFGPDVRIGANRRGQERLYIGDQELPDVTYDPAKTVVDRYYKQLEDLYSQNKITRDQFLKDTMQLDARRYLLGKSMLREEPGKMTPLDSGWGGGSPADIASQHRMGEQFRSTPLEPLYLQTRAEGRVPLSNFLQGDPQNYENAVLKGYIEGPNPSLVSFGGPFNADERTNQSKVLGGEDLANDVFEYYKSKSQPGALGSTWNPTGNPNVKSGFFNNQQSFFTPYDYAISGIYNPTLQKTELGNLDPNYWLNQGNLQNVNNQWGFLTPQDPFASVADPNRLLDRERVTTKLKTQSDGLLGMISSPETLMGLAGWAFGIPAFNMLSSGVSGLDFLSSYLNKDKGTGFSGSFTRPVEAPQSYI